MSLPCKNHWRHGAIAVSVAIALIVAPQVAFSSEGINIPGYAARVGGGKFNHGFWTAWVFGTRQGRRCWGTKGIDHGLRSEDVSCGLEVPPKKFQLIVRGTSTRRRHRMSVSIFVVRQNVKRLRVLLREKGSQPRWLAVDSRLIDVKTAAAAHLDPVIGYAKVVAKANSSIIRVVAIAKK